MAFGAPGAAFAWQAQHFDSLSASGALLVAAGRGCESFDSARILWRVPALGIDGPRLLVRGNAWQAHFVLCCACNTKAQGESAAPITGKQLQSSSTNSTPSTRNSYHPTHLTKFKSFNSFHTTQIIFPLTQVNLPKLSHGSRSIWCSWFCFWVADATL